ncbi:NAD-dependent epimerase/dehydratase family protein [Bacillus sp. J33]|uniref:NAD-dependent epimerase/dehydratase family protein n=1 Tax=Bacillus sp. J33 TaxID=935836 RepID=UPI00047A531E|nr:NAD-dependent epimerase/dehydratase family protein [Bacillus sp. J33]
METVLVTGGCGFIGSHIVDLLIDQGFEVIVVDNLRTGNINNIDISKVKFYEMSILDKKLTGIFAKHKPQYVIHQAAQVSVSESVVDIMQDEEINIRGSLNVIENAVKHNVRKLIFASSAAVYGTPNYLPVDIHHEVEPLAPYGVSKYAVERYLRMFKKLHGMDYTILRYANVYGPRQDAKGEGGVVAIFADKISSQEELTIDGDGEQTRDFVYVKDVAQANVKALKSGDNRILNVSREEKVSVNELYKIMAELSSYSKEPIYGPERKGDIKHSILSNGETIKELNWKPEVDLRTGLEYTLESIKRS